MAVPISNVTRRAVYAPSGAGGVGPYAFTFEILANTDIAVFKDNTLLTLTTHYTVTINANGTGSVTITAAGLALSPTSPTQYAIVGNRTIARATDFTTGGDFFANTINDELDQQTIFAQQNAEGLNRALQAPQTDPTTINMTLPAKATRASKTLAFDADGNPTPGVSAADVANAVTYATNAANSATAAASSASSASSSASSASSSASTASTQASNASTSATNASNSASSASTSATNAASSASTATTQASNASTSATNASNSASAASTSASNAATSETNAAASASTASTQASNASTSASNASTSATNAASSAAAAASALDSFDDRYLGTKTSDPTLDNDGNALVAGALYFSTTQNVMKVYDGASWITATSAGATSLLRFRYVATSGQTTFSGADAASATLTYTVNNIAVHRNGVTLDTSEYTASNGTSIVLNVAAGTGDIVDIIAFKSFTVADALSAVSGGTVNGGVNITGNVGIGTVSPAYKIDAVATDGIFKFTKSGGASGYLLMGGSSANFSYDTSGNYAWAVASNELQAWTAGTKRMVIDASGNVGIGTSSPDIYSQGGKMFTVSNTATNSYAYTTLAGSGSGGGELDFGNQTIRHASIASLSGSSLAFYTNSTNSGTAVSQRMTIDSSGNLLVGSANASLTVGEGFKALYNSGTNPYVGAVMSSSTNSQTTYHLYSTGASAYRFYVGAAGTVFATNTTITAISDQRLKENIRDLDDGLEKVLALKPRKFDWKEGKGADIKDARGFIAQEFEIVFPDMVEEWKDPSPEGEDPYKAVNANLIPTLVKAIQEQQALITQLQADVAALKGNK